GAAIGDFVIAIYNPRSKDRDWQLQNALDIIREYRSENTPIVFARQMGRGEEKIEFYSLGDCPVNKVDMLTLVLIGNSQSLLNGRWFVTPRGYLSD
ncbi:MAG: precorrin-3B C(17)-methyltransferase, partial [Prochlorococcaceae cyanobacterium ETNP14_MAG_4]|nr:precorrin-3B C(17)-methyltransferase [Prochlorococcaceae cyanobacterium ETNP14_MAG_4]